MPNLIEEGSSLTLNFGKIHSIAQTGESVIPVVVQHADTKEVLIIAYINKKALAYARTHKIATFWSTSRNKLWIKGETSGDYLDIITMAVNCEQNAMLWQVRPRQHGACHTKTKTNQTRATCFYRTLENDTLINREP